MVAYAVFKTDLSAIKASVANYLGWQKRYVAALKESEKLLELVNQNVIKSTIKTKEDFKERFKLTVDQWKVMTEDEIRSIEKDLHEFDVNCFLNDFKVNDGREKPVDVSMLKLAITT